MRAARLADQLETGRRVRGPFRLPVEGISARRSTDVVFAGDPAVARAERFVRARALTNPYVEDVARAAELSRTALQARFWALVGRTILNEIQRTGRTRVGCEGGVAMPAALLPMAASRLIRALYECRRAA